MMAWRIDIINAIFWGITVLQWSGWFAAANPVVQNMTLNVTGYAGYKDTKFKYSIVNSSATWTDAVSECQTKYYRMMNSGDVGKPFIYVRDKIFKRYPDLIGVSMWIGFVKPNLDGVWYVDFGCQTSLSRTDYNTFGNDDITQRQCLLLNTAINEDRVDHLWTATSCDERHPFICVELMGDSTFETYTGMRMLTSDALTKQRMFTDQTAPGCKNRCYQNWLFYCCEFTPATSVCTAYKRSILNLPVEITLSSVEDDVILYIRPEEYEVVLVQGPDILSSDIFNYTNLPCYTEPSDPSPTSHISAHPTQYVTTTIVIEDTASAASDIYMTITSYGGTSGFSSQYNVQTSFLSNSLLPETGIASSQGIKTTEQFSKVGSDVISSTQWTGDVTTSPIQEVPDLDQLVLDIKKDNTVDVKSLSSYRNKFISVEDNRPVAKAIGFVGSLCIAGFCAFIFLSDIPKILQDLQQCRGQINASTVPKTTFSSNAFVVQYINRFCIQRRRSI